MAMTVAVAGRMLSGEGSRGVGVEGTLAGRVLEGQRLQRHLATPAGLRASAERISLLVAAAGCVHVVPASPSATAAVAAAVLLDPDIDLCDVGAVDAGLVDKLLVVETVAVSGLRVRGAVRDLLEAGATWVGVAVLHPIAGESGSATAGGLCFDDLEAAVYS